MKPLKLEVIFGSKDSLSPALKHMIGGSKAAASALEQTTKQIAKLKLDQKNIDSFRKFRTELDQTTAEINKHKQVISDLKKQSDLGPLTKQQTQELGKSQKALERLNQTYGQQSQKLTETVQKMNQAGIAVESLTQDESNLKDKILQTTMAYTKQKQAIDRINAAQQQYQQTQAKLQSVKDVAGKGMMLAGAGMAATAVPVKLAVDFESAMADVKKVVDFGDQPTVAAAGLKAMSDEVVRMSTYLPMAAKDIATIVAAGGQSGIAKGELTRFAEDAVKMGVAFDTTAEEAGQSMAEMRTAFRLSQNEVVTLADKINYLGNNTPAAAKSIMQIVQRIGPLGEVGGYASGSIAALGATLKGMGVQEEIAATGIKNMMLALVSGEAATKSQKAVWKSLGLDYVQVAKDMQVNAEETTMKVLQSISKMDKYEQASILKQLFGSESLSAIAPLLTNMEALQKNLDMVGDSTKYAGSMNAEYDARAATTANNLLLLKNNLSAIGIVIGDILLPPLNAFTDKARGILEHVQEWSRANPTLASTLVKLAVGGIAVVGGISAIALAIATLLGPLAFLKMSLVSLSGGIGIFSGLLKALVLPIKMIGTAFLWVGKAMLANPMVLAITAIVAVVAGAAYLIYRNWEPIKGFFTGVWNAIKNAFQTGVSFIKSIIVGIDSVFASNPILNVFMPFIGIPRLIIANWSVISGFFTNLWSAILAVVSSSVSTVVGMVTTGFNTAASFTSSIWNSIKNIVTAAWQGLCNIFIAISPLPYITSAFNSVFAFLAGLYERMRSIGSNIIQGLIDGVKSGFGKLKDLWGTVNSYMPDFMRKRMDIRSPSRVMAGIGGHIMGGLQVGLQEGFPSLKNKFSAVADVFHTKFSNLPELKQKLGLQPILEQLRLPELKQKLGLQPILEQLRLPELKQKLGLQPILEQLRLPELKQKLGLQPILEQLRLPELKQKLGLQPILEQLRLPELKQKLGLQPILEQLRLPELKQKLGLQPILEQLRLPELKQKLGLQPILEQLRLPELKQKLGLQPILEQLRLPELKQKLGLQPILEQLRLPELKQKLGLQPILEQLRLPELKQKLGLQPILEQLRLPELKQKLGLQPILEQLRLPELKQKLGLQPILEQLRLPELKQKLGLQPILEQLRLPELKQRLLVQQVMPSVLTDQENYRSNAQDFRNNNIAPALAKIQNKQGSHANNSTKSMIVQGDTISIHLYASPGQNIQQLQHMIESVLNKREQEKLARIRSSFLDQE